MASDPNVAPGGTNRSPGEAVNPSQLAGNFGISQASLPVPQYCTGIEGIAVQYNGGPMPDYQMPVVKASTPTTNVPFTPARTDYKS